MSHQLVGASVLGEASPHASHCHLLGEKVLTGEVVMDRLHLLEVNLQEVILQVPEVRHQENMTMT